MGIAHEWIRVLIAGGVFGLCMGLFDWFLWKEREGFVQPSRLFVAMNCLFYALGALGFGIFESFGLRSFHSPLLFLLGGALTCMFVLGLYTRKLARGQARRPRYPADSPLSVPTDQPRSAKSC
jgi:hypothetical protein